MPADSPVRFDLATRDMRPADRKQPLWVPFRRGIVAETAIRSFGARLCLRPVRF